jgi:hypothetical protein
MKTVWRPGKVLKSWAKAAMLGIVLIPTIIIANQQQGRYRDSDTIPDPTSLQPLDASVKTEQLSIPCTS